MDGKTILPRSEVPEEFTWNLSDIQSEADRVAVINAAYSPRPMLKCNFFSLRGNGRL